MDERTGEIHDYRRKKGVLDSELILPGGGTADRAEFWNSIEVHHKRGDAVLVREVEISLPTELTPAQRQELAVGYARELADRYGVAADVALHAPRTVTDQELEKNPAQYHEIDPATGRRHNGNWHAHIMLSACHVQPDGTLGKKAVELDPIHCKRAQIENVVDRERPRWAELANQALEKAGQEARIDHRSLAAQGITDRAPTVHLGPTAAAIERSGRESTVARRAREKTAKFLAEMQAQAAIQQAAARDVAELEAQLAQALQQADAQTKVQAERQRIERLSAAELAAEIERLRPPRALDLVERDQAVLKHGAERQALQRQHTEAGSLAGRARDQAEAWREAHKVQVWFHDRGLGHAPALRELEEQHEARHAEAQRLAGLHAAAEARAKKARELAHRRIQSEQAPTLAKLAELEELRKEKQQQELQQQRRQEPEPALTRERDNNRGGPSLG